MEVCNLCRNEAATLFRQIETKELSLEAVERNLKILKESGVCNGVCYPMLQLMAQNIVIQSPIE